MWPFSSRDSSTLKGRLILAAVMPGLVSAILLSGILMWVINGQQRQQQQDSRQASLSLLEAMAKPLLQQKTHQELPQLAQKALLLPQLRSISFRDANLAEYTQAGIPRNPGEVLSVANASPGRGQLQTFHYPDRIRYLLPVHGNGYGPTIGWIDVEFSTQDEQLFLYRNLTLTGLLLAVVTCAALLLASLLFARTTAGFHNIQQQLQKVARGQFDTRITSSDNQELNALIDTLNQAIAGFALHQQELQEHINQSTQDLRETLETVEIQNIELDLARKEALNASKIKSEFLANTSHEIRTPLNGIIGFTRLLLKDCPDRQQREYLTIIQQSSENLLNLINDILDLSKIEAGKLVLEYESFPVHQLVEETLQILAPAAHEKGLELAHQIDAAVPEFFYGDAPRLKQIFTNLIGNAIKFSNTGSILVKVAGEKIEAGQALIKCSVSDTGIGIRRSQLNQDLFNAFSQAGGNTPQQRSGAGLGLAISKKLVDQMGGDMGIDSEENVGSTFWFTIKLSIDRQAIAEAAARYRPHLEGRHILLFDTNAASRQSLYSVLDSWGARVTLTQHYAEVFSLLNLAPSPPGKSPFAAVIISIPVDLQRFPSDRISELVTLAGQHCPVVVNSPVTLRHYLEKNLPPQAIYLSKPFTRSKLMDALQRAEVLAPDPATTISDTATSKTIFPETLFASQSAGQRDAVRLLVVDDHPANLALLSRLLRDYGHEVHEAGSGRDALALCEHHAFDCIFMDIRMPEMDGVETTQRIRLLNNSNRDTPVIAVTAQAMADEKHKLLLAGLDDYLSKPLQEPQLQQALMRWLPQDKNQCDLDPANCVDVALAIKLSHGNAGLAADMLEMLLNELAGYHALINQMLDKPDIREAREQVHKLHGACCYCGVPELKAICKKMEQELIAGKVPGKADRRHFNQAIDHLLLWKQRYSPHSVFNAPATGTAGDY